MNIWKQAIYILIMVFVLGSLSGCLLNSNVLAGTDWELIALNRKDLIPDTTISLQFSDEYLGGQMGCNGYGGTADTGNYILGNNGRFSLGELLAVAVQLCVVPEGIMEQEEAYIEALMRATHFRLSGDHLELENDNGNTILVFKKQK